MTFNIDIAKRLAAFERRGLRRMFGRIKVDENWGESDIQYNELMQMFADLGVIFQNVSFELYWSC